MNLNAWLEKNKPNFGSDYEALFAQTVLPLVSELRLEAITVQYPFQDTDRRQRYCDFVIHEKDDVRIAIEIDGYDKRGAGTGMSHTDFVDWQRRQAALTSQGWYVLRFANRDVRDDPKRCAEHISLLLKRSRSHAQNKGLSTAETQRLDKLSQAQADAIEHLNKETSVMKYTITAFTTVILVLVMVIVWQSGGLSPGQRPLAAEVSSNAPEPSMPAVSDTAATTVEEPAQAPLQVPLPPVEPAAQATTQATAQAPVPVPAGANCDNPISWQQAKWHIGQTAAVAGPLIRVTQRDDVPGKPTWIDIGAPFPDTQRLMAVIWGQQKPQFPMLGPGQMEGKRVCIMGRIDSFKGVAQIQLRAASQFVVLP